MGRKTFQDMTVKQTLNRVKEMPFAWSINPYRGCAHGCSFCYARATHSFLGMQADDSFQNHIFVKVNAAEALEQQLSRLARKHGGDLRELARAVGLVAIGTATDPYQQVEAKARLTRACLEVLAKYQIPTTITTRSPLILRDLDILRELPLRSINISINTLDAGLSRRLEPAASFPRKRLETVQRLAEDGLPAGIFLAPILPYLTDGTENLRELIAQARQHRAAFAVPSVLRLVPDVKAWYFSVLAQHYPKLLPAYRQLYRGTYPPRSYTEPLLQRVQQLLDRYRLPASPPARLRREPQPVQSAAVEPAGQRVEQLSFLF
jgi:DNA repair photolyase